MVKHVLGLSSHLSLDLRPVAVANLISEDEQQVVGLLTEELGLLGVLLSRVVYNRLLHQRLDLLLDDLWGSHVEADVLLSLLNPLQDLASVVQSMDLGKEHLGIPSNLLRRLGVVHVLRYVHVVVLSVQFEGIGEPLELLTVPFAEACVFNGLFFDLHLWSELDDLFALDVATVLGLKFDDYQFLEPLWVREEPEVCHLGQFLLLGFIRHSNTAIVVDLGSQVVVG